MTVVIVDIKMRLASENSFSLMTIDSTVLISLQLLEVSRFMNLSTKESIVLLSEKMEPLSAHITTILKGIDLDTSEHMITLLSRSAGGKMTD